LAAVFLVRVHQQRALAREASETLAQFREERQLAQTLMLKTLTGDQERLDEAIAAARRGLDRFQALSDAEWFNRPAVLRLPEVEREDLRREVADLRQLFQKGTELFDERERFHRRLEAVDTLKQFRDEWRAGQLALLDGLGGPAASADGLALCRRALDRYHVLDDPHWTDLPVVRRLPEDQQAELREELGELLLLLARVGLVNKTRDGSAEGAEARLREALRLNRLAETCYPPDRVPGVVWRQRAELLKALGDEPAARAVQARAEATPPQTVRALCLLAGEHLSRGRYREALPLLEDATRREPQNFWAWFDLGLCHDGLFQYADAVACYNTCQALWPRPQGVAFRRGVAELQLRRFAAARADFDQVLAAHPDFPEGYINRGLASLGLDRPAEALADLDKALGLGTVHTRAFFIRARIKDRLGDADGARRDREEGLRRPPNDERGWTTRALARLPGDPAAALADVEQALALNPQFLEGLQNKAHVLAEFLHRTDEAVAVLDRLIELYPDYVPARAGRGVLLARLGKRAAAHADAEQSLFRDTQASTLYQVAGVYALTSREVATDRLRAFELLSAALRQGYGFDLIDTDPDLAPIRELPEFQRLVAAARTLQAK
jgi:tetratricopeptide (TPR) repeat protein